MDIVAQLMEARDVTLSAAARSCGPLCEQLQVDAKLRGFAADVITELRECIRAHVPETAARKMLSFSEAEAIFGPKEG